ncbi:prephenate dehydrogenase [Paenibacillus shenyangensis]|uniref:prephenate dehydrogenase n=1 Tax=Paenibacillus sp. A9 TaxID=1284352 RepID=UPI0003746E5B|nr:prephenate dehydrogenase [Paenibacillus sp. A9]
MTTKIAIFGVGLIGGSLALCFKGKPGLHVTGYTHLPELIHTYQERQVVDHATLSVEEAAQDADFIFLCVPVSLLGTYLEQLSHLPLKPGCIITDVGSTKASIVACAEQLQLREDVHFIGGHPMAGSERSGVGAASYLLFENAYYVLTPPDHVPQPAYERLAELLTQHTRAQIIRVEPLMHDEIVGAISHLPHVIAVALVNQIRQYNEGNPLYRMLAAGGFRDITRIASSDPIVWRDILLNNRHIVLQLLEDWNEGVEQFIELLKSEDARGIEEQFEKAGAFRDELPERRKGMITKLYDLYLDVPDHPGIIGKITTEIGNRGINISNVQIIESREDVPGVMRLSFRNEQDMEQAKMMLQQSEYSVFV